MAPTQFYYTEKRNTPEGEVEVQDSFNLNLVTITYANPDGSSVVLLNDFREQYIEVPVQKGRTMITERRKMEVCSELKLNPEDTARFRALTEIK